MNRTKGCGALLRLAILCCAGVGLSLQQPQCPESYTITAPEPCLCEDVPCDYTITIQSTPLGAVCSTCVWNYSWSVDCGAQPCDDPTGNGTVNLSCSGAKRGFQKVVVPCPASGGDWVTVLFTCGWCR